MTVLAYAQDDPDNPLAGLSRVDVERLPFGAVELDRAGTVIGHIDTEPGGGPSPVASGAGTSFFSQLAPWAGRSRIADEFKTGAANGAMNVVFDCAVRDLAYKVRIHLKISPILGTFWVFIKKLTR